MRIRIVTFALTVPAGDYVRRATDLAPAFGSQSTVLYAGRLEIKEASRDTTRTVCDATLTLLIAPSLGLLRVADQTARKTRLLYLQRQTDSSLLFQTTELAEPDAARTMKYSFTRQDSGLLLFAIEEQTCSFTAAQCNPPLAQYYLLRRRE